MNVLMPHARTEPPTVCHKVNNQCSRTRVKETVIRTETPAGVQSGKHPGAEESGSNCQIRFNRTIFHELSRVIRTLNPPSVIVERDDGGETDAVERPTNMPIEKLF